MGYKSERWEELLQAVVAVMEVERDMVLCRTKGGHSEAATDARWVLVRLAGEELTDVEIAKLSGLSRQTVNDIRNHGDERLKRWGVKMGMRKVRERVVKSEDPFPAFHSMGRSR
jgi:hypothetical protein